MHFRYLASCLLARARPEEALLSFEAGRALAYSVEVDGDFFSRVIGNNPFAPDGTGVDLSQLRRAQKTLHEGEVAVVLAVIPPRMIAFIVDRRHVHAVESQIGATQADIGALDRDIKAVPSRLAAGTGVRAVPQAMLDFAKKLATEIGSQTVRAFIPYDSLHMVPWRAVLRHCGIPWEQLQFPVGFSFLLRQVSEPSEDMVAHGVVALGHGVAGSVDLNAEARAFAERFASGVRVVEGCSVQEVREALGQGAIVLLSCHGRAVDTPEGLQLLLELRDGTSFAEEVFPPRVASPLVILSACDSGVYHMAWSDYPLGAGPSLLSRGAVSVIGARFPIRAQFAANFFESFESFGRRLADGMAVESAFVQVLAGMETIGVDYLGRSRVP
jgi:hypothetical protein